MRSWAGLPAARCLRRYGTVLDPATKCYKTWGNLDPDGPKWPILANVFDGIIGLEVGGGWETMKEER